MVIYFSVLRRNTESMNPIERKARRQQRLADLVRDHFHGNQTAFAEKADIAATLVSRYLKGSKGIGEDMRNKIEKNTGFVGWFDDQAPGPYGNSETIEAGRQVNESQVSNYQQKSRMISLAPPAVTLDLDADCLLVWQQLQQLPPLERERWRAELDIAAGQARLAKLGINKKPEPPARENNNLPPVPKLRDPA